jgi:hypothetical protein
MTEKHPKRPRDPNQLAKSTIDIATGKSRIAILMPGKTLPPYPLAVKEG